MNSLIQRTDVGGECSRRHGKLCIISRLIYIVSALTSMFQLILLHGNREDTTTKLLLLTIKVSDFYVGDLFRLRICKGSTTDWTLDTKEHQTVFIAYIKYLFRRTKRPRQQNTDDFNKNLTLANRSEYLLLSHQYWGFLNEWRGFEDFGKTWLLGAYIYVFHDFHWLKHRNDTETRKVSFLSMMSDNIFLWRQVV